MLFYLNGVGETWLPLATSEMDVASPTNAYDALQAAKGLLPGEDGVLVAPAKGDAIAFFNYADNGSFDLEHRAVHAGLPAKGNKQIGTLWYRLGRPSDVGHEM